MIDDRTLILARRARFLATALAGITGCGGATPAADRAPSVITIDEPDAGAASETPTSEAEPPKRVGPSDRDGDGVIDDEDKCPDEPGPADEDDERLGCPRPRICLDFEW